MRKMAGPITLKKETKMLLEMICDYQHGKVNDEVFRTAIHLFGISRRTAQLLARVVSWGKRDEAAVDCFIASGLIDKASFDLYAKNENLKKLRDGIKRFSSLLWAAKQIMKSPTKTLKEVTATKLLPDIMKELGGYIKEYRPGK